MKKAQIGDRVRIRYIGTLDNGRIFDNREEAPLEITLGEGEVFTTLEEGIVGLGVGEARNIVLTAEQAFGPHLAENTLQVPLNKFPPNREMKLGQKLEIEFGGTEKRVFRITAIDDSSVTLDANHPLAGLDLTFALQLDAILDANENGATP